MDKTIILIGPVGAGKTTISELLSEKLNIPSICLDLKTKEIFSELGYDFDFAKKLRSEGGFLNKNKYDKKFEAESVKIVLNKYPNCIHDFGAGHTVYEDLELLEKVRILLKPHPNVIFLFPCPDKKEALKILQERREWSYHNIFLDNDSNEHLAKITIYTKDKTPEETCQEIISKLQ